MAASPWKTFPPTTTAEAATYPQDGDKRWFRMRDFSRKPFIGQWLAGDVAMVNVVDPLTLEKIDGYLVPWYELDAWKPLD